VTTKILNEYQLAELAQKYLAAQRRYWRGGKRREDLEKAREILDDLDKASSEIIRRPRLFE
jgi:ADP-heptose:LPS heptosyltransferase